MLVFGNSKSPRFGRSTCDQLIYCSLLILNIISYLSKYIVPNLVYFIDLNRRQNKQLVNCNLQKLVNCNLQILNFQKRLLRNRPSHLEIQLSCDAIQYFHWPNPGSQSAYRTTGSSSSKTNAHVCCYVNKWRING